MIANQKEKVFRTRYFLETLNFPADSVDPYCRQQIVGLRRQSWSVGPKHVCSLHVVLA